ncbi:GSCOCT00014066001.2-RA-CDS, partial [Cotesia congregata]
ISSGIILINELLDHCGTSYEIASLFGITFGTVAALIKISLLNVNHKNILYIVLNVVDDWWKVEDEKSKNIMRENSSWNGILFYGILTPLLLYTSKFVIESIPHTFITDDNTTIYVRTTPMSSDCWNLADIPTVIYLIRFACRTVEFIIYNITSCGIDLYFLVLASHICGQIEINNMNIKNFFVDRKGVFERDYFYKIIYHATGTILYFSSQIFIYCYAGEKLSSKVEESCNSVYDCCWYDFSISMRKDIVYIIQRLNKQYHLTAGKFYHMNLPNFTNIVKTMVSFFSVMRLVILG